MTDHYSSDSASYMIIDNAPVYGEDKVKSAKRGMLLTNQRRTLVIKDEVEFVGEESAFTTAHFESENITAEVSENGKKAVLTHSTGEKIYVTLLGDGCLEVMNCTDPLLSGTEPAEGEYSRDKYSRLVVRYNSVRSINTAFVINTSEDAGIKENISVDMWKSL